MRSVELAEKRELQVWKRREKARRGQLLSKRESCPTKLWPATALVQVHAPRSFRRTPPLSQARTALLMRSNWHGFLCFVGAWSGDEKLGDAGAMSIIVCSGRRSVLAQPTAGPFQKAFGDLRVRRTASHRDTPLPGRYPHRAPCSWEF